MKSLTALLVVLAAFADAASADTCAGANRPGATLLIPYFEVDLDEPQGADTLFSVNNADHAPALAHVILWTDRGLPTLAFDLYLDAHSVRSLSMRRILAEGRLPVTGDASTPLRFPSCAAPLALPELDAGTLAELRAKHAGRPTPDDGLCYGEPRDDDLAVGYVTVDVVRDCSDSVVTPHDPGYFSHGDEPGLLSFRNVLWGDVMLVDPRRGAAQGFAAVARPTVEDPASGTFWLGYSGGEDRRAGLGVASRTRCFDGGAFDGGTELLVWHAGTGEEVPRECGPSKSNFTDVNLAFAFTNEAGETLSEPVERPLPPRVSRLRIGADLPAPGPFGFVAVAGNRVLPSPVPWHGSLPLLAVPLVTAEQRFSVGLESTETKGRCTETPTLAITTYDGLYEIDLDHGTYLRLLDPRSGFLLALAKSPEGRFFALAAGPPGSTTALLEVEPATGKARSELQSLPRASAIPASAP